MSAWSAPLVLACFGAMSMPVQAAAPLAAASAVAAGIPPARPGATAPASAPAPAPLAAVNLPAPSSMAEELTRLQEQTVVLKAELKKLDAQAQVAERTAALSRLGATGSGGLDSGATRVLAIEGLGGRFSSTLQTSDGQQFEVYPGDTLPNGMRVVSIRANQVIVRGANGHQMRLLPTTPMQGVSFNPALAGQGGGAPGVAAMPASFPPMSNE